MGVRLTCVMGAAATSAVPLTVATTTVGVNATTHPKPPNTAPAAPTSTIAAVADPAATQTNTIYDGGEMEDMRFYKPETPETPNSGLPTPEQVASEALAQIHFEWHQQRLRAEEAVAAAIELDRKRRLEQ